MSPIPDALGATTKSNGRKKLNSRLISPGTIDSTRAPATSESAPPIRGSSGIIVPNCVPQSGPRRSVIVTRLPWLAGELLT